MGDELGLAMDALLEGGLEKKAVRTNMVDETTTRDFSSCDPTGQRTPSG
jgi:hypothetical protein